MAPVFDAAQVARHNTVDSCWVILYGKVYDVTDFLGSHPGGPKAILSLAGKDATEEYDPIHPPGTLEEYLKPEAVLGAVSTESLEKLRAEASSKLSAQSASAASLPTSPSRSVESGPERLLPLHHLLNLDDIEHEATKRISKRAWAYYYSASDDMISKYRNNAVYRDISMRQRVLVDVKTVDTCTTFLGHKVDTPVFVAPAAMARLAHPDGELGIARAAALFGAMQIVSHNASMTPEQIVEGAPSSQVFGWQLYVNDSRAKSEAMLRRIAALGSRGGYKFICLTLDAPTPGKRELDERTGLNRAEEKEVSVATGTLDVVRQSSGVGKQLFQGTAADLTWETTLPWLARHTDLPIVLKGIQAHEDAYRALQYPQIKAVILSNHGGRAIDTAPPPIHTLLEIRKYCPEVLSRIEVWIDGGVRRGTDVVKALCLGARGVGVGRAPLYSLGAGGQRGVERMFEILQAEIATAMRLVGVKTISDLGPSCVSKVFLILRKLP